MNNNNQNSLKIPCPFCRKSPASIDTENYVKTVKIVCEYCNRIVYTKETNILNEQGESL